MTKIHPSSVIPAKAGIHSMSAISAVLLVLIEFRDPGFRRDDEKMREVALR
jgi:hypothetical protein